MCKYCEPQDMGFGHKELHSIVRGYVLVGEKDKSVDAYICGNKLSICVGFDDCSLSRDINYCPMCGRKLSEDK